MEKVHKTSWIRNHTLKAAGITYLLGDACLFISGMLSGRTKEATAGLLYMSGGAVSAIFGNPSDEQQIKNVGVRLGDFMKEHGAQILGHTKISALQHKRMSGMAGRVRNFLYAHPAEVNTAIYAYGGTQLIQSGFNKGSRDDIAAGALVTAGGLIGAFVPENKDGNWVSKKPLRTAGYLWMANNAFLMKGSFNEYKSNPGQRSYIFKFATALLFMVGNTLMSFSSHDHTAKGDNTAKRNALTDMAAEVIAAQPEDMRISLIRETAGFLSSQPETRHDMANLTELLDHKVTAITAGENIKEAPAISTVWQDKARTSSGIDISMPAFS